MKKYRLARQIGGIWTPVRLISKKKPFNYVSVDADIIKPNPNPDFVPPSQKRVK